MDAENDIRICISPSQGKITIEEQKGLVTTRKEVSQQDMINCFKNSVSRHAKGAKIRHGVYQPFSKGMHSAAAL